MSVKKSLLKNLGAGAWGNVSLTLVRLVQVPLLLHYLGVEEYGRRLILSSLPSWLSLANLGFGSVAANEMTMSVASGNVTKARGIFSTAFALIAGVGAMGLVLSLMLAPVIPWEKLLLASAARHSELVFGMLWLVMAVLVSFTGDLFGGRFRAAKKAHLGMLIASLKPWLSLLLLFAVLQFSTRLDYLAFSSFCSIVLYAGVQGWLSNRAMPALSFSIQKVEHKWFKSLFRKGIAFQAFPLGNALLFQGNLLIVQAMLGPAAVALFGTARTLVRSVNQVLGLINHAVWPELSVQFGAGDMNRVARLHRVGVAGAMVVALAGVGGLALIGPQLYELWVGETLALPRHLLLLFLLPIPFNALWNTSSVVHSACNQHEGLAKRYLFASLMSLLFCVVLAKNQGIEGAALSTLIADIILIPYVFTRSLVLTQDRWRAFLPGLLEEVRTVLKTAQKPAIQYLFKPKLK